LKILHVSTFFEPEFGYEEYCTAKEQAKNGHDVHVICTNLLSDRNLNIKDRYISINRENKSNITVHRLRCFPELKSEFIIPIGFKKTFNAIRPDIVHAHTATQFTSWLAVKYAQKYNIPIVVDIHGIGWKKKSIFRPLVFVRNLFNIFFQYFVRSTIANSDMLVPKAKQLKIILLKNYGVSEKKVFLNEIGVDTDIFFSSNALRKSTREKYSFSDDERVLIFFGFIRKEKRLDLILDIMTKLSVNYKLIVAGPIDKTIKNDMQIQKLINQLSNRLILTGTINQPKLNMLLNASDLAVWPANVSVGILQSSIIGLPSLYPDWAYDIYPISKEAIISDSKIDMIKEINNFLNNKTFYNEESDKARKYALSRTYNIKSKQLIELYNKMIYEN